MRFKRLARPAARPITNRRVAAAKRALQKERDRFPLLVNWIVDQQPTPEERLKRFQTAEVARQQYRRDQAAATWRWARNLLRVLPAATQQTILRRWNTHPCPASASYFADMVFQSARPLIDSGAIVLPDPSLDPRYRLQKMVEADRERRLQPYRAIASGEAC